MTSKDEKLLLQILRGAADANIPFDRLCELLHHLGFTERQRGSHHIFFRDDGEEILNLQPKKKMAKPYQVKQVRLLILRYGLGGRPDEQI